MAHPEPETETVPDCVTLSAPPEAGILSGRVLWSTVMGEFAWIKYLLPRDPARKRRRNRRKRKKNSFSILFSLEGKYILFKF